LVNPKDIKFAPMGPKKRGVPQKKEKKKTRDPKKEGDN
jgi:hypothetical protein